jgi:hypothetical protein
MNIIKINNTVPVQDAGFYVVTCNDAPSEERLAAIAGSMVIFLNEDGTSWANLEDLEKRYNIIRKVNVKVETL